MSYNSFHSQTSHCIIGIFYKQHIYKKYLREFTAMSTNPEMEASNLVKSILSETKYKKDAKKRLDAYNIDITDQRISHAVQASKVTLIQRSAHSCVVMNIFNFTSI